MNGPYYITLQDVKNRLYGKVQFVSPPYLLQDNFQPLLQDNGYPICLDVNYVTYNSYTQNPIYDTQGITDGLLADIISQAEAEVSHEFSSFYQFPLIGFNNESWQYMTTLPQYNYTVQYFKNIFIIRACLQVCKFEFGRNSNVNGDGIIKYYESEYKLIKDKLYEKNKTGRYIYPPVPGVKISPYVQWGQGFTAPKLVQMGGNTNNSFDYANRHVSDPSSSVLAPINQGNEDLMNYPFGAPNGGGTNAFGNYNNNQIQPNS